MSEIASLEVTMKTQNKHFSTRLLLTLIMLCFAMTCSLNAVAKPDPKKNLIKEAAAAYEKDDFDTALAKFNEAYDQDPSKSSILYNIGRVYESKADYNNAISYYKQFISAPGSDENARKDALNRIKNLTETLEILSSTPPDAPQIKTGKAPKAAKTPKAPKAPKGEKKALEPGKCIDINNDPAEMLVNLNGVGDSTANKIIAARPYASIDDLSKIGGIGPAKINKMRDQICPIGGSAAAAAPAAPAEKAAADKAPKAPKAPKPPKAKKDDAPILDI